MSPIVAPAFSRLDTGKGDSVPDSPFFGSPVLQFPGSKPKNRGTEEPFLDTQSRHLLFSGQLKIENRLGNKDRREKIGDQADDQGNREALHRSGSEDKQKRTRYHGSDMRVDNGQKGFAKAGVYRRHHRFPGS